MMEYSATLQERHLRELQRLVLPRDGREGAAYLLLGRSAWDANPWAAGGGVRFLSREVLPIAPDDVISSSNQHIHTRTRTLAKVLRRAKETESVAAFVHGHSAGFDRFSEQDDRDEPYLIEMAQNRNGPHSELVSVVLTDTGRMFGRVWHDKNGCTALTMVKSVGDRLILDFDGRGLGQKPEVLSRQALAFGDAMNDDIATLRFGIIGCGATGSAVAMLLLRLGARRVFLVDNDLVTVSNLNRLHYATVDDIGMPKVEVLKRYLERIGLGVQVATFAGWVGEAQARNSLKACDVLFGCTDDNDGRLLLNRFAYFYLTPLFDMGIGIDFVDESPPRITHAEGRVTVAGPGSRCLLCRGVVNPKLAQEEDLLRRDPAEYQRRRAEGEAYVRGGGRPNPAIVTFTTDVACMAVDEFIHRLTGYRAAGSVAHRVRKHHLLEDKKPGPRDGNCQLCVSADYWGRGDIEPFLDRVG